ncbi:MAG: hypothetical protein M1818_000653 [Claussenomyces sp. TS43310]|nr:MAG: hypothetical protein M1818_000653 [Claussenomyces sp. TS43310]
MDGSSEMQQVHEAIRYCMTSLSWTSSFADGNEPPDPRFRKWLEGIHFSHKLILTYHLVIFSAVTVISAVHWSQKALRWRRRRFLPLRELEDDAAYDTDAGGIKTQVFIDSSSSSTSSSSSSSTTGNQDLSRQSVKTSSKTPLLQDGNAARSSPEPRWSISAKVKAFLMYQPRPTPLIGKVLPSNGTSIFLLMFIGLNVFYTLFRINFNMFELIVLSFRAGLLFVANLPLLYLLAAKTQPIKVLTGFSYESLNILHRRLGEILMLEALIHCLATLGVWYTLLRPTGLTFVLFIFMNIVLLGLGTFFSYSLLYFTSLASFRATWYELFLGLHVGLQVAALVLLFLHHRSSRVYVGIALAIFLIDRLVYRIGYKSTTVVATLDMMEDSETVRLSAVVPLRQRNTLDRIIGRNIRDGWQAADHVFISAPSLAWKHAIQAHPFTIASSAPTAKATEARIDFLIRAQDGFSADLLKGAMRHSSLQIRIDGPYGSSHARDLIQDVDVAVFVAGGSGIAVCWPLVQFLVGQTDSNDPEIASKPQPRHDITLVWVVHRSTQLSWVGSQALTDLRDKGVKVIVPDATEEVGRPNLESIIDEAVENAGDMRRIGVVGSGPDSMGRTVRNTCARLVRNGGNVGVTIEKFGW